MSTATIEQAWERYAASGRTPRRDRNAAGAATWFNWTSHPDHGPTESILGPVAGRRVLELGSGTGCNLAHLATLGAHGIGLDVSPTQTAKAQDRWGHLPVDFAVGEAVAYLGNTDTQFDIVYSVFGAHWFTDPDDLLPLVAKRLTAGGVYAFSHTDPADVKPVGPKAAIARYDWAPNAWERALEEHGFHDVRMRFIAPPAAGGQHTLIAVAHT